MEQTKQGMNEDASKLLPRVAALRKTYGPAQVSTENRARLREDPAFSGMSGQQFDTLLKGLPSVSMAGGSFGKLASMLKTGSPLPPRDVENRPVPASPDATVEQKKMIKYAQVLEWMRKTAATDGFTDGESLYELPSDYYWTNLYPANTAWDYGTYEFNRQKDADKAPWLFKFTDKDGRTSTYGRNSLAPFWNLDRAGVTAMTPSRRGALTYEQFGSALTGNPSYRDAWNSYYAGIADEDWSKVYRPLPKDVRGNFRYGRVPRTPIASGVKMTWGDGEPVRGHNFYNGLTGSVISPSTEEEMKAYLGKTRRVFPDRRPTVMSPSLTLEGGNVDAVLDMGRVMFPAGLNGMLETRHEDNHWATTAPMRDTVLEDIVKHPINPKGLLDNEKRMLEERERLRALNGDHLTGSKWGPGTAHPETYDKMSELGGTYAGDNHETIQAVHSLKDALEGLQTMVRTEGPEALGLTGREAEELLAFHPRFRDGNEMESAFAWLRKHPHVAHRLGLEPGRALHHVDVLDDMSRYIPDDTHPGWGTFDDLDNVTADAMRTGTGALKAELAKAQEAARHARLAYEANVENGTMGRADLEKIWRAYRINEMRARALNWRISNGGATDDVEALRNQAFKKLYDRRAKALQLRDDLYRKYWLSTNEAPGYGSAHA